jgi:hypothetical protein
LSLSGSEWVGCEQSSWEAKSHLETEAKRLLGTVFLERRRKIWSAEGRDKPQSWRQLGEEGLTGCLCRRSTLVDSACIFLGGGGEESLTAACGTEAKSLPGKEKGFLGAEAKAPLGTEAKSLGTEAKGLHAAEARNLLATEA